MQDSLDQTVRRSQRRSFQYWYADGFTELSAGLLFWILAAYFAVIAAAIGPAWWLVVEALALPVLVLGGVYATRWLVRTLKIRYTYPRTGYVGYQRKPSKASRRWRIVAAAIIGIVVGGFFSSRPEALAWIPAVQGMAVGLVLFTIASRVNLLRFYIVAVISVLLGVGISLRAVEPNWGNALFYAVMGIALVASGLWALSAYVRRTEPPAGE